MQLNDENEFGFTITEIQTDDNGHISDPIELQKEWEAIDNMVFTYQSQFVYETNEKGKRVCKGRRTDMTELEEETAKAAGAQLIHDFYPMVKKYVALFKTGQINYSDEEQKKFVYLFMDTAETKKALWKKRVPSDMRAKIYQKFNFVRECYGKRDKDDMIADLQEIILELARRYNNTGKSFCTFLYFSFNYTVARKVVKPYQKEVLNFHYKKTQFEEFTSSADSCYDYDLSDVVYEDQMGLPDMSWLKGDTCSDIFSTFTAEERNILSKYYLAGWNDSQIADAIGMHINTVNTKRRRCLKIIAEKVGKDISEIKRNRRSGKKAIGKTL